MVYLVLPPVPAQPGQALADQDLEAVAGGEASWDIDPYGGWRTCMDTCGCYTYPTLEQCQLEGRS